MKLGQVKRCLKMSEYEYVWSHYTILSFNILYFSKKTAVKSHLVLFPT